MARSRSRQVTETRERILTTAEQLFAERGVSSVSNRQISEAAGQGNNFAVGYHFGGRAELIRAILERHGGRIEPIRQATLAELGPGAGLRDWLTCLVRPHTDYFESLGPPTYFARFCAQVTTDPQLRQLMYVEAATSESLLDVLTGMYDALPPLPGQVREARDAMTRNILVHTMADFEFAHATGHPAEGAGFGDSIRTWADLQGYLVDALTGMWLAPTASDGAPPPQS